MCGVLSCGALFFIATAKSVYLPHEVNTHHHSREENLSQ